MASCALLKVVASSGRIPRSLASASSMARLVCSFELRGAHGSVKRQALLIYELDACHGYVSVEVHAYGVECLVDSSFQIVVHTNGNIAHLNHLP